jgi:hypothetical protein
VDSRPDELSNRLDPFDESAGAKAATTAHRDDGSLAAGALQFVYGFGDED